MNFMEMDIRINGLQHVGIPVTDIVVSKAFYRRLGFRDVMVAAFVHEGESGTCCMMERDKMILELYQMPEKELTNIRSRNNGHIDHVAFDVSDIDETFAVLKSNGFHVIESSPVFLQFWKNGCRYFNITGPDGERLEFNQIL
ncbi:MAG: hypothetical protein C0490_25655 [Marivirga sp.]|nr:hypothetical protein [Marivirga sp.]